MKLRRTRRLPAVGAPLAAGLVGILMLSGTLTATASPAAPTPVPTATEQGRPPGSAAKPTIVLVHGAFADSSGWNAVTQRLLDAGYPVLAFSNPLRGPISDAAYLRDFLSTIDGPVVLVGHSYGGAVITNAATGNPDVQALVYVAAYAPAEGESVAAANALGGGHTEVTDHLVLRPFPGATGGDADALHRPRALRPAVRRRPPRPDHPVHGRHPASRSPGRPAHALGPPAWETIPSWYLVAGQDRIIPPEAERAMAARAGATTVEIKSSHVAMMSHPQTVVRLIEAAAR